LELYELAKTQTSQKNLNAPYGHEISDSASNIHI